ncbi:hypothetical protein CCACVL1_28191 [Corchorus capsularis]|uniref:Uncharacterized protein n=1 Tax=Corchorus capsularis TaxID=210143 RepID=A0A1R3G795_COCAP|nr:hypothetical protein CCACVL1_28191 [Corchorus capsularis]
MDDTDEQRLIRKKRRFVGSRVKDNQLGVPLWTN